MHAWVWTQTPRLPHKHEKKEKKNLNEWDAATLLFTSKLNCDVEYSWKMEDIILDF